MGYTIQISQKVASDIKSSEDWYKDKDIEIGTKFRNEVKTRISQIRENPEMFKEIKNDLRRANLGSSFPYSIYYSVNKKEQIIRVLAVVHQSKNLEKTKVQIRLEQVQTIQERRVERTRRRLEELQRLKERKVRSRGMDRER